MSSSDKHSSKDDGGSSSSSSSNSSNSNSSSSASSSSSSSSSKEPEIRDVWADNLDEEMINVRRLAERYHYISMDTEFPGVVARPMERLEPAAFYYEKVRINVNLLKIIQLGVTFTDNQGRPVEGCCCFQFNFQFNVDEDMQWPDSIDLLKRSGIDFAQHKERGIDVHRFGELLISSGLVLTQDVTWVSFHGGFDFGYLLKLLTCLPLPLTAPKFFEKLRIYFPSFVDVKHLTDKVASQAAREAANGGASASAADGGDNSTVLGLGKLGLSNLGDVLKVPRIGNMHTAGSDSLLTAFTYFKLKALYFNGNKSSNRDILGSQYHNLLFSLAGIK